MSAELHMASDIGSAKHRVAIGLGSCREPIEEFDLAHTPAGQSHFFKRVQHHAQVHAASVCVAMEGFGGYAHPLPRLGQLAAVQWTARPLPRRLASYIASSASFSSASACVASPGARA